eukprot:PhF_6_TR26278/c0_g1_i2/m.37642
MSSSDHEFVHSNTDLHNNHYTASHFTSIPDSHSESPLPQSHLPTRKAPPTDHHDVRHHHKTSKHSNPKKTNHSTPSEGSQGNDSLISSISNQNPQPIQPPQRSASGNTLLDDNESITFHFFSNLNEIQVVLPKDRVLARNAANVPCWKGSGGKYYCGRPMAAVCPCCDGMCGPTKGC